MKAKMKAESSNLGWFSRLMHKLFAPRYVWRLTGEDGVKVKFQCIGPFSPDELRAEHAKLAEMAAGLNWCFVQTPSEIR